MPHSSPSTISCPGCGRAYNADRFAHGRSLHCTCGARVGQRLETGVLTGPEEPRFMVDSMLGRLARWLRTLGYDAAWEPEIADAELVRRGVDEGRITLTRDRKLAAEWWIDSLLLLENEQPLEQLREVAHAVELSRERLFTRCTHCNTPLHPTAPEPLGDRVPATVRLTHDEFHECPACERVYWEGGHTERMRRMLDKALG